MREVGLLSFSRLFLLHLVLFLALLGTQQVLVGLLIFQCHWRVSLLDSFPCGSAGKESACNAGDLGLIPGLGRSPGEGIGYPLQYSGLENSKDGVVPGVAESRARLRDFNIHWRVSLKW